MLSSRMTVDAIASGDQAIIEIMVAVAADKAFEIFTAQIGQWWRRGRRYRMGSKASVIAMEPGLGGRLFESIGEEGAAMIMEFGRITRWSPP
jgi:hypothetical protein